MSIKISEYKTYLWDYLQQHHNITNQKKFFHCLNPNHIDNNPSMMFTSKYNICKCFSCGVRYDIFDLIGLDYNLDSFKEQLIKLQELYLEYVPNVTTNYIVVDNSKFDYTNYYNKCKKNIDKTKYLENRRITKDLIKKYNVGYDVDRELAIFPINKKCYFARSTINSNKIKSKGKSDIWNKEVLLNNNDSVIYVTEGIIDSLSLEVIDPQINTISINGIGNTNLLLNELKNIEFKGLIVIAFDNDKPGAKAAADLKKELTQLNIASIVCSMISSFDEKDINEALIKNKDKLKESYNYFNKHFQKYIEEKEVNSIEC